MKIKTEVFCPVCGRKHEIDVKDKKQRQIFKCDCGADFVTETELDVKCRIYSAKLTIEEAET